MLARGSYARHRRGEEGGGRRSQTKHLQACQTRPLCTGYHWPLIAVGVRPPKLQGYHQRCTAGDRPEPALSPANTVLMWFGGIAQRRRTMEVNVTFGSTLACPSSPAYCIHHASQPGPGVICTVYCANICLANYGCGAFNLCCRGIRPLLMMSGARFKHSQRTICELARWT